jgi:hypothetical protein
VTRTIRAVFAHVRAFRDAPLNEDPENPGNLLFFASNAALQFDIPADARFEGPACEQILRAFQGWEVLSSVPGGPLITDAKNPLSRLQMDATEKHFWAMNQLIPREVWLNESRVSGCRDDGQRGEGVIQAN